MTQQVNENNNSRDSTVCMSDNTQISMKLLQSIYHEITGKSEKLSKFLRENHEVNFEDLNQFNTKINQMYEQYNVISKNCSVTVYYTRGLKEQFSSFDRFQIFDKSSTSACENIVLVYDFLIILPTTKTAQPYKITLDLLSKVAILQKAQEEQDIPKSLVRMFGSFTGKIDIDYVDYNVGKNFLVLSEDWYHSVKKNNVSKIFKYMQKFSDSFAFIFHILTISVVSYMFYLQKSRILSQVPTLESMFGACIVTFGIIYLSGRIASKFGSIFEDTVDSHQGASAINLNLRDQKIIEEYRKQNNINLIKLIAYPIATIILNLISSYIAVIFNIS